MLHCHVTLSGVLPSPTLFITIFSVIQSIASMVCFFKVCVRRTGDAMDLKYGIEPIPDPWSLTVSEAVHVEGKPKFIDDGGFPAYGFVPTQVMDGYEPKAVVTGNNYSVCLIWLLSYFLSSWRRYLNWVRQRWNTGLTHWHVIFQMYFKRSSNFASIHKLMLSFFFKFEIF